MVDQRKQEGYFAPEPVPEESDRMSVTEDDWGTSRDPSPVSFFCLPSPLTTASRATSSGSSSSTLSLSDSFSSTPMFSRGPLQREHSSHSGRSPSLQTFGRSEFSPPKSTAQAQSMFGSSSGKPLSQSFGRHEYSPPSSKFAITPRSLPFLPEHERNTELSQIEKPHFRMEPRPVHRPFY